MYDEKKRWEVSWEFRNAFLTEHGSRGTETVSADDESEAKNRVKEAVSRRLFGTTGYFTYVVITKIQKANRTFY